MFLSKIGTTMTELFILAKISIVLILLCSCNNDDGKVSKVDFKVRDTSITNEIEGKRELKVAISAMISPEQTLVNYEELIKYLSLKINKNIILEQRKTYSEVNELIVSGEIDFAFICSGAYVNLNEKCQTDILAVPQKDGRSTYQAYIIVNQKSGIKHFRNLKGKSFAYTDPLSNTGKLYAIKKIKEMGIDIDNFFSRTIYTHAHDNSIMLVNKGNVDGATVDGLIYNYYQEMKPELISNTIVIEKSEPFGIPPIVSRLDRRPVLNEIRKELLSLSEDTLGKKILDKLKIDKFVPGYDSSYNSIRRNVEIIRK
jgi:phosphonate transport system substrate-binding protein